MSTAALVSPAEYLATTYRPDCDYIDGELVERNVGELSHGRAQLRVSAWFLSREGRWRIKAAVEVRLRIHGRRFRIPDVMVLSADAPVEQVVVTPPRLCIEILSPSDTLNGLWERIQDYLSIGVPECWIVDPLARRGWRVDASGMSEAKDGILRAGEIEMPIAEVLD